MSTDPCAPRNLVRKRIIYRNCNPFALKFVQAVGMIAMFLLIPMGFAVIVGLLPVWYLVTLMSTMIISISIYAVLWFKMLDKMKNSPHDRKFVNKMLTRGVSGDDQPK
jgi:membrane protein implicated in regulation of membrane protease activity